MGMFNGGAMRVHAHRIETTLKQDGTLVLRDLPFYAGESVQVLIFAHESVADAQPEHDHALRGMPMPVQYDGPTEPIAQDDWDALR